MALIQMENQQQAIESLVVCIFCIDTKSHLFVDMTVNSGMQKSE